MPEEAKNKNIRKIFKSSKKIVEEAYENIRKYQTGALVPAKTGYKYIDDALLGGLYPQNAIAIGARPSEGKSYVAQKIMENVMNPYINPQAGEYFLVNCEFEMNPSDLILRRINRETNRSIRDILLREPTKIEEEKIAEILKKEMNPNIVYIPQPCTPQEFEEAVACICESQRKKKLVIFKIDHIALTKRMGGDAKRTMDTMVAIMNDAKLKYHNVLFFIISQFNREIEGRTKPMEHAPRMSDFYMSDELGQLCSLMIGLNNPRRRGINEYMKFPSTWYQSLDRFKTQSKTSFKTDGLIFHHILKVRQTRMEELDDIIYPEIMPGWGAYYGEGGVKYVNPERPPEAPRTFGPLDDEEEDDVPY